MTTPPPGSPLVLSWITFHGRSADLAAALAGEAVFIATGRKGSRLAGPWRYLVQAARTWRLLERRRPRAFVVMAPPSTAVVVALVWAALRRSRVVVDAHTGAVLHVRTSRRRAGFAWLARRAAAVIVTNEPLAAALPGARVLVLDDPPAAVGTTAATASPPSRRTLVFPAGWAPDEPWAALVDVMRARPDVDLLVTGRVPAHLAAQLGALPPNVTLTGYLARAEYDALLAGADAVVALTTREATMQRAGYEALAHGRPLLASDTRALRHYFADAAVYVEPTVDALCAGVDEVLERGGELAGAMAALRPLRAAEFTVGLNALREVLEGR